MQTRHSYLLSVFEKLGTPLLAAVAEAVERDRLQAQSEGRSADIGALPEAERLAVLLKSAAEMGFTLSRQLDLRMTDATEADAVRLALAGVVSPLVANLYRVNGRAPSTLEIDRFSAALQAVTLFADNYNAAADANARMQGLEHDFAPADGPQVQLMTMHALLPAINAVCTFSFGQPEKALLQDVMERLNAIALDIRRDLLDDLPERDAGRAEISLLRAAATLYSQAHFTEMSKLMFLDEEERNQVDLNASLQALWRTVDHRLSMLRTLSEIVVTGQAAADGATTTAPSPAVAATPPAFAASPVPPATPPLTPATPVTPAVANPTAAAPGPAVRSSPFATFTTPPATDPVATKSSPLSAFAKPKESATGG